MLLLRRVFSVFWSRKIKLKLYKLLSRFGCEKMLPFDWQCIYCFPTMITRVSFLSAICKHNEDSVTKELFSQEYDPNAQKDGGLHFFSGKTLKKMREADKDCALFGTDVTSHSFHPDAFAVCGKRTLLFECKRFPQIGAGAIRNAYAQLVEYMLVFHVDHGVVLLYNSGVGSDVSASSKKFADVMSKMVRREYGYVINSYCVDQDGIVRELLTSVSIRTT